MATYKLNRKLFASPEIEKMYQEGQIYKRGLELGKEQGYKSGYHSGFNKAGIVQGIKNTWNNSGNLGKAGMAAAGAAGGYMMYRGIKSMFRRKPKPQPQQAPAVNIYTNAPRIPHNK